MAALGSIEGIRFSSSGPRRAVATVVAALAASVVTAGVTVLSAAGPAAAYPGADISVTGHGWGHGFGMGQWGALGYALGGSTYSQILSTYYGTLSAGGATHVGALPNGWSDAATAVTVAITANAGADVIVTSASPFTVSGVTGTFGAGGTVAAAVRFQAPTGGGTLWTVQSGPGCAGGWTTLTAEANPVAAPVTPAPFPAAGLGSLEGQVLQLCQLPSNDYLRGSIGGVLNSANQPRTVNVLPLGQYVADVTPSESPQSWGTLGGAGPQGEPAGFQELEAQAVAARSYVMSTYGSLQGYFGYADICDSACQSYPGVANENALTDTATADTADTAVLMPSGAAARTQYSSSTGGYTNSGGTFAPVPDAGDSVCVPGACNAHHSWQAQVPVSAVESAYPQIGALVSAGVSQRNGLGDLGGRVVQMTLQGTASSVTISGGTFAAQFSGYGVQSDWFALTSQVSGGVGGYWTAASDGGVFSFGDAAFYGSLGGIRLTQPVVGMAPGHGGAGYWMVASDGGIFAFGDAGFHGSMGGRHLDAPMVGMAPTADGAGYWTVASDGGMFAFGDAGFSGSMGGRRLVAPMVGMAPTPDGAGYWTVASDGGVFSFGDAAFHGSLGGIRLAQPVVGMAPTPDGGGYWLVAADGGVFAFGDAAYAGSLPGIGLRAGAVSLLPTATGLGYLIVTAGGQVVQFGDAPQFGDVATAVPGWPGHMVSGATVAG